MIHRPDTLCASQLCMVRLTQPHHRCLRERMQLCEVTHHRQPTRAGSLIATFAAVVVSGCSLTLSGPDPRRPIGQYPTCDTGKAPVVLDIVDGTGFGLGAVAIAGTSGTAAAVLGSIGAAFYLAAYHGKSVIGDCRDAIASVLR